MDFHKNKGKEMEGAVGERKKIGGKEKASASDQTNKVDGTFHVNFEMDIKKTVNIDMPTTLQELKKHVELAGKEIVGDKGKTNLDSYEFTYSDGRKKHTVNTEKDFRKMQ